jgi:hypothetical protein
VAGAVETTRPVVSSLSPLTRPRGQSEGAALGVLAHRPPLAGVDDAPPERLDPAQRVREIVDLEVGKGDGVARTLSPGVHPDRRRAPARLPALALSFDPVSDLHAEQTAPEAKRPFGLVGGELHQSQLQALHVRKHNAAASCRTEREFSDRDRDVLDIVRPGLEPVLRAAAARVRLVRALAAGPPPGTAVVLLDRYGEIELSSLDAERWLADHFGATEHPAWLPGPAAWWLALPPRPPLVSERDGRRLTVRLLPGDPHALLLEEEVASFRPEALDRLGLTARETEVLRAAAATPDEAEIACELFLSLHAVRERLERLEAKLACARPRRPSPGRAARARRHRPRRPRVLTLRWADQYAELLAPPGPPLDEDGQRHRRRPAGAP